MFSRRRLVWACLGCVLLVSLGHAMAAQRGPAAAAARSEPIEIGARPIAAFVKGDPSRRMFGRLEFLGGLELTSADTRFGGLSDLAIAPDGRRLLAVSDEGTWLSADVEYDGERPAGLSKGRVGPLLALGGASLTRKRDHDAEAMTLLKGTLTEGMVLIGFERNHRIGRFPVSEGAIGRPTSYMKVPPEARRMKSNHGFEAITVLRTGPIKGSVVAMSERLLDADGNHSGWIWVKGVPRRFAIKDLGEFDITSAAALDNGGMLLLERRFRWTEGVKMRLRYFKPGSVVPGAVLAGDVLLEADMSYEIDNMEGLAVHPRPRGGLVLTIISDDNFNRALQRTLLLQFALPSSELAALGAEKR